MEWKRLKRKLYRLMNPGRRIGFSRYARARDQVTHVIILDGTLASLRPGYESHAGITYKLLSELNNPQLSLYYEAGIQWSTWKKSLNVLMGRGINGQIQRAYGYLAKRYRPGDQIYLIGYSRGGYAVRSLAGIIDRVGLLRAEDATQDNICKAYHYYQCAPGSECQRDFSSAHCYTQTPIKMIGVWDTVKALGLRLPLLWRFTENLHAFHNHHISENVENGFQALALDENRSVFNPILWETQPGFEGRLQQVWFRGSHGDIGGYLLGNEAARPLANIPLVWMLEAAQSCGLELPKNWESRFPRDRDAPSTGNWKGLGMFFLIRSARKVGMDPSERIHETAQATFRSARWWRGIPSAIQMLRVSSGRFNV